jgi:hypothetical protein
LQLLDDLTPPAVAHEKTDTFREQVEYSNQLKCRLAGARKSGAYEVRKVERELGKIADAESGVVIDLYLSYRATSSRSDMVALVEKMAPPLAETVLVREQLGLALNRLKRRDEAEAVLTKLIEERGPQQRDARHPWPRLQGPLGGRHEVSGCCSGSRISGAGD